MVTQHTLQDMCMKSAQRCIAPTFIIVLLLMTAAACLSASPAAGRLEALRTTPGFHISLYADGLPGARSMAMGVDGVVFVGTRKEGRVYAVVDTDGDHRADRTHVLAEGLNTPNGVAYRNGSLYVAEVSRILRFDDIDTNLSAPPPPAVVRDDFPTDYHHGWKYIAFGPDGLLYVPVGAPCNVCARSDRRYAAILRMRPDGSALEIVAEGIRNTVGFDWHPRTGDLWFTNNGRDWMGDDLPPDTLHRVDGPGRHFGFPFCHAGSIPDPEFGDRAPCSRFDPPAARLGAHVAPLGMAFYNGRRFPPEYRGNIFIAEHGSWNRSLPVGYRITRVVLNGRDVAAYEPFVEGWLQGRNAWGRPVDVVMTPEGDLLVSDDRAGVIYRITYTP